MSVPAGVGVEVAGRPSAAGAAPMTLGWRSPSRSTVDRRDLRPAAARDDAVVALDRLLGVLHGRRRQRRQRRLRHMDGAGGLHRSPGRTIAFWVLLDQRIEGRVLAQRRRVAGDAAAASAVAPAKPAQEGAPVEIRRRFDHVVSSSLIPRPPRAAQYEGRNGPTAVQATGIRAYPSGRTEGLRPMGYRRAKDPAEAPEFEICQYGGKAADKPPAGARDVPGAWSRRIRSRGSAIRFTAGRGSGRSRTARADAAPC